MPNDEGHAVALAQRPTPTEITGQVARLAEQLLGALDLKDAQVALRDAMVRLALARCEGSRRAAARMLGVDRAYVRRLSRDLEEMQEAVEAASAREGRPPQPRAEPD